MAAPGVPRHGIFESLHVLEPARGPRRMGALRACRGTRCSHTCLLQWNTRLVSVSHSAPLVPVRQLLGAHDISLRPPAPYCTVSRIRVDIPAESRNPRGSKANRHLSGLLLVVVCRRYMVTALGKQQKKVARALPRRRIELRTFSLQEKRSTTELPGLLESVNFNSSA